MGNSNYWLTFRLQFFLLSLGAARPLSQTNEFQLPVDVNTKFMDMRKNG